MGFRNALRTFGVYRQLVIITGQAELSQQVGGQHLACCNTHALMALEPVA